MKTKVALDVIFWRSVNGVSGNLADDKFIDHESVVDGDWEQLTAASAPLRVSKTALQLPYVDSDGTGKFHVMIHNVSSVNIPAKSIIVGWAWRGDVGE